MGSFAMVRGIGVFVGGFVDPVTLVASPGPLHNSAAMVRCVALCGLLAAQSDVSCVVVALGV